MGPETELDKDALQARRLSTRSLSRSNQRISSTESTPLLSTGRNTPRQITSEGITVVVYPIVPTSKSGPCYFALDPPISLQEDTRTPYISPTHYSAPGSIRSGRKPEGLRFVPTPMYRSRIMELNRLLASSYESRKSTYNAVAGTMLIVAFLLALFSMLVATRGYYWVTIIVFVVIGVSVSSFKPLLESVFFTKPLASVQNQARQLMHEWNSRSPPHLRFRIVGGGLILEDLNRIIGLDPELHVIFLDEPVRPLVLRSHSRSTTPAGSYGSTYVGQEEELGEEHEDGTVFVVPDETRDGLMMTVKIVSKPSREKINFDDERIYGQFGRSSNNSPENPD